MSRLDQTTGPAADLAMIAAMHSALLTRRAARVKAEAADPQIRIDREAKEAALKLAAEQARKNELAEEEARSPRAFRRRQQKLSKRQHKIYER